MEALLPEDVLSKVMHDTLARGDIEDAVRLGATCKAWLRRFCAEAATATDTGAFPGEDSFACSRSHVVWHMRARRHWPEVTPWILTAPFETHLVQQAVMLAEAGVEAFHWMPYRRHSVSVHGALETYRVWLPFPSIHEALLVVAMVLSSTLIAPRVSKMVVGLPRPEYPTWCVLFLMPAGTPRTALVHSCTHLAHLAQRRSVTVCDLAVNSRRRVMTTPDGGTMRRRILSSMLNTRLLAEEASSRRDARRRARSVEETQKARRRCTARTTTGRVCKRRAVLGNKLCACHAAQRADVS